MGRHWAVLLGVSLWAVGGWAGLAQPTTTPAAIPPSPAAGGAPGAATPSLALPLGGLALGLLTAGGLLGLRRRWPQGAPLAKPAAPSGGGAPPPRVPVLRPQARPHHPPHHPPQPAAPAASGGAAATAPPPGPAPEPQAGTQMAAITQALAEPGGRLAICGPAGSGRRFLAEAFAAAEGGRFAAGTLRLDGSRGFAELGLQLLTALHSRGGAGAFHEGETLQELLRRSWRSWSATAPEAATLLVLTDLPSDEGGRTLEQRLSRDLPASIRRLVSQRSSTEIAGCSLQLGGWAEPEALRLLRGPEPLAPTQEEACRALVAACAGLPFTLALLCRRAGRRHGGDWSQLLEHLRALEPEAQADLPPRSPLAQTPLAAAVLLALWQELDPQAHRLALLLGAMGPAPVPTALLAQCAAIDPVAASWPAGFDDLQGAGLVRLEATELHLHPLVRQFLRWQGRRDGAAEGAARAALVAALAHEAHGRLQRQLRLVERLPLVPLLPHLREVLLRERRRLPDAELLWPAIAAGRLLEGLEAEEDGRLLQHCLEICEAELGRTHPETAVAMFNLAAFHDANGVGDARAETLLLRALAVRQRCFGDADPTTAAAMARLGLVHAGRGELERAIPLLEQALQVREQIQGPRHPELLGPLNRLMDLQEAHGAHARAERLGRQVLEIQQHHLGADHPDLATTLLRLGHLQEQQGRPERAEALYEQALTLVGADASAGRATADGATASAILGRLGGLALARGEEAEAEQRYRQALALLAEDEPEAGHWLHDLARLHLGRGELAEAERLTRELLALRERTAGPWHPLTAGVLNELAWLLSQNKPCEESLRLCERALAIRRRSLGAHHLETAASLNTLATLHEQHDDWKTALPLYQQALEITENQLGPDHPGSRTVRANLRSCSDRVEQERKAS